MATDFFYSKDLSMSFYLDFGPQLICVEFRELSHLTRDFISSWEENECCYELSKMHKMKSISLKMIQVIILSENSYFARTYLQLPWGAGNVYFLVLSENPFAVMGL